MRGRQQYYLTFGCASNRPWSAPHPRRDMPIFRGKSGLQERAGWDCVLWSCGPLGLSGGGAGSVGHAHSWREEVGYFGLCPALERAAGYVPRRSRGPGPGGSIGRSWKVQVF